MKQKLLFYVALLFSFFSYCQVANQPSDLSICDDDNDGFTQFDLTLVESEILGGQNPNDFTVSYYLNQADADSGNSTIANTTNFTNYTNPQTIWVRVEEISTGNFETTSFDLYVNLLPEIILEDNYYICDGNSITLRAINGTQNYTYLWNTGSTNSQILVTIPGTYTVTVTRISTGCSSTVSTEVGQSTAPNLGNPEDVESCNGVIDFDLTQKIPEILNGINPNTVTLTFYDSIAHAFGQILPITNPETYTVNQAQQNIYVRVNNLEDTCFSIVTFIIFTDDCPVIVNCDLGSVNTTYCYMNNDSRIFAYESSDGSPLSIVFNSGITEANFDEVYIMDSDRTILNSDLPYGNDGDFEGITYTSTGSRIYLVYNSDSSLSCGSGSFNVPFDFDVFCANSIGIIEVNAFIDDNSNEIFDIDETPFSAGYFTYEINNDGIEIVVSSSTGHFNIYNTNESNVYSINFNLFDDNTNCYNIITSMFNNVSVSTGSTVDIDFPVIANQNCEDLAVYLINNSVQPRPAHNYNIHLVLENLGFTTIDSGTIEFNMDDFLIYNSASNVNPNYTLTPNSTGFTLDFVDLQPGSSSNIYITIYCPNTLAIGELVTNTATYTTTSNDTVVENNVSSITETIIGSYDPNDIIEAHGPQIVFSDFAASDEYLYYLIRFQNIGTAEAINIRIEDVLSSQLNKNTFQMLRSSHDYVVTRTDNQLVWQFDDINLPSQSVDDEGSKGYVYFKIKPQAGYGIGDIIPNTAEIYFDANPAIITNTFTTEFVETLSVTDYISSNFSIYPNPANSSISINLNAVIDGNVIIFDLQGKAILTENFTNKRSFQIDVSTLESGLYFVRLNGGLYQSVRKLIIN